MQKIRLYDATKLDREHMMFSNKQLITLLLPIMVEQLLNSFMGMADTMMVSNVGSAAISAVSLVDSINVLVIQVFTALGAGAAIICSQYLGRGDRESSNEAARQVTLSVLTISTVLSILCIVFRGPLLHLIFGQVEEAVMDNSMIYFLLTAISFPFIALFDAGGAFYRAAGNSRFPMMISVLSNGLNIAGNAVLIFGFQMGVEGAALSTLFSRIFCAVVIFWNLRKPDQVIVVNHYLKIRPNFPLIGKILSIGIPSGIENGMFQFGKLAIQSTVSTLGTAAIAANAVTNILENLNGVAAQGVGIGLMTIVGQCIGAGRKDEAIYYIKKLSKMAEAAIIISCLVVFALCRPITILGGMESESARMCFEMTLFITITKPISWVLSFIPAYGMRAAGDVKFSMITSCASMWLCRVSFTIFLCRVYGFGPIAVWIGMFADWTVRGIVFTIRFHSRRWLNHHIID